MIITFNDPKHIAEIDRLVPHAESIANKEIDFNERPGEWSRLFHQTMNKMAADAGLRVV